MYCLTLIGNSMTSTAIHSILKEMKDHFPDKPLSKDKIKDHVKHLKSKFTACYDIFKNGLSGFRWDATNCMWLAEPKVWDALIEVLCNLSLIDWFILYLVYGFN